MKSVLLKAFELIGCRKVVVTALGGNALFKVSSPDIAKHKYQMNEIGRLLMSYGLNSSIEYQETDEGPCILANMNGPNTVTYIYPKKQDKKPWGQQEWGGKDNGDFSSWAAVEDIQVPIVEEAPIEELHPQDESLPLVTYVRKNLNKLRILFLKPLGYQMVEKMLQQDLSLKPGVSQLICPIVNQRVDQTLTDTTFKRALDIALSSPALKKEWEKKADLTYLVEPVSSEGFQPAYESVDLDFNSAVAQRIADQLSFGFETLEMWNVPEAPSERQQIEYIRACLEDETKFAQKQRQNLYNWVKERDETLS
jgi:hypothetical protein